MTVYTPFLFGIPGQTYADGLKTIEFAMELDPDIANFHAITPFPGTELYDNIEKYGTMSEDLTDLYLPGGSLYPLYHDQGGDRRTPAAGLEKVLLPAQISLAQAAGAKRSFNDLMAAWQGIKKPFLAADREEELFQAPK